MQVQKKLSAVIVSWEQSKLAPKHFKSFDAEIFPPVKIEWYCPCEEHTG